MKKNRRCFSNTYVMKKALFLLLTTVIFASCEQPEPLYYKSIHYFDIKKSDWILSIDENKLNNYYYCSFNFPKLTENVFDGGSVSAYLDDSFYQQVLPIVRHHEDREGFQWTTTTDFDFEIGKIKFYVTNSDFVNERPEAMTFRVVLMW